MPHKNTLKRVKIEKPKRQAAPKQRDDVAAGQTLFIRNISFDTEQEDLQEFFSEYGEVEYCLVCVDKETGHSKGSAFVKFKSKEDADKCLEASKDADQPFMVDGRKLFVAPAISKDEAAKQAAQEKTKDRDKRNLYLAKEGLIYEGSPAAEGVSQKDLEKRLAVSITQSQP